MAKILAIAIALGFGLEAPFTPGMTSEAWAFRGGGHFGGGHFGGFGGGHFGGFGGGHFGGLGGAHFGRFGGGHFGRFGGTHFGGTRFGHFGGFRYGHAHFHYGHARFQAHRFAYGHFRYRGIAGHQFGRTRLRAGGMAFAHNHFAGAALARFHGIHGLDTNGFNRNGFGGMRGWNRWAQSNWGAGWNNWGSGWGYWAGPVFWPFLYGDVLTFALWPYDFYDPFFFYGPDFLLSSIFWPGPLIWPFYGPYAYGAYGLFDIYGYPAGAENYYGYYHGHRHYVHHRSRAAAASENQSSTEAQESCDGLAPAVTDLPIAKIKKAIRATPQQTDMLDQLKAASAKADAVLRASCPSQIPLTPVGRLDTVAKRLNAMIEAVGILRTPLMTLNNSLDDKQKDELAALGRQGRHRQMEGAMNEAPGRNLAALCKKETANFTLLPVQRIEDVIKPNAEQKTAFEALQSASTKAAANLDASCPSAMPQTLDGRLDAVVKRLDALSDAVDTVKPALVHFYDSLSDEQKARFNLIGVTADTPAGAQAKTDD